MSSKAGQHASFQANNTMLGVQDSDTEVQALEAMCNLATASAEEKQATGTLATTNAHLVAELV